MPSPEAVIARVFTSANPTTGSQPRPEVAWVVFAHCTAFFTTPTRDLPADASLAAIAAAARAALRALGPVMAGSPSADFSPVRLAAWYPDDPVWFVGFAHPNITTLVTSDADNLSAGLEARQLRRAITTSRSSQSSVASTARPNAPRRPDQQRWGRRRRESAGPMCVLSAGRARRLADLDLAR